MRLITTFAAFLLICSCAAPGPQSLPQSQQAGPRPEVFPQRIWAACDFELLRKDVLWGGRVEKDNVPAYPANRHAAASREIAPGLNALNMIFSVYPRAESGSRVYFRYFLRGNSPVEVRLFNQNRQAWHRLTVDGLVQGQWAEATVDFGEIKDDSDGGPLESGERVSEVMLVLHGPGNFIVDDIICFAGEEETGQGARQKFPRRVIAAWGFDPVEYYHPWTHTDYRVNHKHKSLVSDWGVAEGLDAKNKGVKRIRLIVDPPQQVGANTRVRYNYWLDNVRRLQPMIFDLTDSDNRHVGLETQPQGQWLTGTIDFTVDGIKNDGNQTPFEAGSLVDDIFYLAWPEDAQQEFTLLVDDVVLYDAYE